MRQIVLSDLRLLPKVGFPSGEFFGKQPCSEMFIPEPSDCILAAEPFGLVPLDGHVSNQLIHSIHSSNFISIYCLIM